MLLESFLSKMKFFRPALIRGTAVVQWLRRCATNRKVAGSIPTGISGFFIDINSFRSHYGPGVDSASNRNELLCYKSEGRWFDFNWCQWIFH